ncbi:tetratricopeptide repeat protein [Reichenbachiella sp.]|uniref:O-linked N-acetylglucosamine transferase family protein n=1 Tax=Reichenbachiella sp. TaxID=2184521 RepID=UPI003B5CF3DB
MITGKAYYDQLLQEATLAHQSGDLAKAITLYRQLTTDMSGQPEPYHRLALIYAQKAEYKKAIPWFEKAIDIRPDHSAYCVNFAETLQRINHNDKAIDLLRKAIEMDPNFVEAQQKLGTVLKKTGAFEEAAKIFKLIIEKEPKFFPAFFQLGTLMLETGNFKSAKDYLKSAVALNPKSIKALNNLAVAHQEWEEYEEAIECYESALVTDPNYTDSIRNLALIYEKTGKPEQSKLYWNRLANLKNNDPLISWKAEIIEPTIFTSTQEITQFRRHVEDQLNLIKTKKVNIDADQLTQLDIYPPAGLIYHGRSDLDIKTKYGELFKGIPKVQMPKKTEEKPHVGFVVTGGHEGVFLKCMRGLINCLSTDKFEITVVCSFPNGEKIVRPAIENPAIKLISLPKSLGQSIHLLSSLSFDFLHYWEVGTDAYNYFIPYFKPARVQVTSWGWPTTSGIPTMDYFISCHGLDEEVDQKDYSEKLVLFDKLPAFYYSPEIPTLNKTKTDFGIKEECRLYLCAQNVKKVHPDFDQLAKGILEQDEKGIVAFLGDKHAKVNDALEKRIKNSCGTHAERVIVLPRQDKSGYFNILNLADVVLDTVYYNGGANTNGDAFALNKPVVTLPVDYHRGRYTATAYAQMGFYDLVARSFQEYSDLAVRTASDIDFRNSACKKIEDNKHLFFEDQEAVQELESFIEKVTQRPQPIRTEGGSETAQNLMRKGLLLKQQNKLKLASDVLNQAQRNDPNNIEILKEQASILSGLGKEHDAFLVYQKALRLSPNDPELLNDFGGLLIENSQFEEAIPVLKKSAELDPKQKSAFINLGLVYEQINDIAAAQDVYGHLLKSLEDNDLFKLHIETLCPQVVANKKEIEICKSRNIEAIGKFDRIVPLELLPDQLTRGTAFPSYNLTYHGYNIKEIHARWGEFYAKRIKPVVLGPKNPKPKVGFLVTHGHEGVFMKGGCGLIKQLSSEKFDLVVLVNGEESLIKIRNFIDRKDVRCVQFSRDLQPAVREIQSLNLDFLYYWEVGSDALNYFLPFYQLGKIQILSWGSPYTSGNPRIQYYWASKLVESQSYKEHYSEEVALFDQLVYYYYRFNKPAVTRSRKYFNLPEHKKIYLCIQSISKIHPDFDSVLKSILEKDEEAVVALVAPEYAAVIGRLQKRFERTIGVSANRILFLPKVSKDDYAQRIALADVCLDTLHYAGFNTTYETLQMGTPVVSLPGEFQRGKYTAAIYRIVGLEDFIPQNNTEYVDLAVRLAHDHAFKNELISTFNANAHRLFEQGEIVQQVEKFLQEQFDGLKPNADNQSYEVVGKDGSLAAIEAQATSQIKALNAAMAYEESFQLMDSILSQNPQASLVWFEKGLLHYRLNQFRPAFDALNKARQLDEKNPEILKQFALLLSDLGKNKDAQIAFQKALLLSPDDPEILNNFGGLLLENRQFEEAIPLLKKSAEIDPNQQSAFVNLGLAYENNGEFSKAKDVYSHISTRLPDDDLFKMHIETLCPNISPSNEANDEYRNQTKESILRFEQLIPMRLSPNEIEQSCAFPSFSFTYQGRNVKEIKSLWGEFYAKRIQPVGLGSKNKKPKVGFLVTQSHEGVFMKDAGGMIKNLSSEKFDLVVLANGSEALEKIKTFINRTEVSFLSISKQLGRAVHEITSLNLDFIYYWEIGSDALNYFLPFYQLARVQISSWGSAFTSGNPRVQYYWSSKWLENESYPDHYTEQVVLLEQLPTYYYRIGESQDLKTRADFDLPEDRRVYLCVQNMSKLHPDFDQLLLGILEADDKALICLTTPKQEKLVEQLLKRFRSTLFAYMDRIRVLKKIPHQQYLQLIKLADVCLDPPHYSGANTTYETLQMGVPVVTLPGNFQRGKYTEALYRILELEDFIPGNNKAYIDLAIEFAQNPKKKAEFMKIYNKNEAKLFEQSELIDEIEDFLLTNFDKME